MVGCEFYRRLKYKYDKKRHPIKSIWSRTRCFFRQSTKAIADQLNVSGWVKNCSDGTVEVLIWGSIDKLNTIITWLHTGPDRAVVEKL